MAGNPPGDPFIVSTSLAKPDARTRRFIRSHVMRGKNLGKFARSRRPPIDGETRLRDDRAPKGNVFGVSVPREDIKDTEEWILATPRNVALELSLLELGDDTKPYVLELIHRAFTVVKPALYGMEGMSIQGGHDDKLFCFANLAHHPGILHSTLFIAQTFHDLAIGITYGSVARLHLAKALRLLQTSLDDKKEAVELSTMAVVASLAMAAVVAGDLEAAGTHMDGLHRIVELRGGLRSLGPGSMIEHKAKSLDLGLAMGLGQDLRFFRDTDISWSPQIAQGRSAMRFPELTPAFPPQERPDPRLLNVWADLREFSKLVNDAAAAGTKVPTETAAQLATSVPHRLLRLQIAPDEAHAFPHELLRWCMLAYTKMLLIKLPGIGRKMTRLTDGLRVVLTSAKARPSLSRLMLWGAFVASVSVFEGSDEEWLVDMIVQSLSTLGLQTWTETRAVLKGFLWIDLVFDRAAERMFDRCCGGAR